MRRTKDIFQTVKTEGAILPVDLLRRIVDGDRDVPGLRAEDYHLARSERLNEAATRAWNRLQGAWEGFKAAMDKLPDSDTGTSLTRERWLLILFQELGYGRLTTRRAYEIEGKTYPISHDWQNTPIHLVSFRQELDKRTPGRAGAARVSPHSLVQEFLNRSDDHLWGFASNGLTLRLLRDNVSLTRQAYVEFDLQAMMDGEAYSDFFLLYLLCHQSRVEVPEGKTPEHCWLEKWYNTAAQQGVRALDQLRNGVQNAIEALGGGFLAHPANEDLRQKLRSGQLSTQDYYRQVLRQVYRLLFLFVAEDRDLLFDPAAPAEARKLYTNHYSTQRLRSLAAKTRGTRHPDLWRSLRLVFAKLHGGCEHLALPALGSFLFNPASTADINDQDIANTDLLKAIRSLSFTVDRNVLRPVNYRNLGPEELGSVYESLLEMHPAIHMAATNPDDRFKLTVAAGSERKTTGSYYTPTSLVNCLLDSALNPIIDEACHKDNPAQALLDLKICDPACGSGHFLIAAAHRIAHRLAGIRAGEDEPSPDSYQQALRDVIGRCIYGVDINPMSVELCKVSLWMEAMEPGKPLAFLDHHIQCGNSLLGTTPALMKRGIPDAAFKPIEGDDKDICKELKKRNKDERTGKGGYLFSLSGEVMPWLKLGNMVQSFANLSVEDDSTPEALAAKEQHFVELVRSAPYENARLIADAWCAAFVCEKKLHAPLEITEGIFRRWEDSPHHLGPAEKEELAKLREQYNFFHWHLAFPEVFKPKPDDQITDDELTGWSGGFDCVLGNPPWDVYQPEELKFFALHEPSVLQGRTARERKRRIQQLENTAPEVLRLWISYCVTILRSRQLARSSGFLPLTSYGKMNLYASFAELDWNLLSDDGRCGAVVPSGLVTDEPNKIFLQALIDSASLISLYDFENSEGLFPDVHRSYKFSLLTVGGPHNTSSAEADFVFYAHNPVDLAEEDRHFILSAEDVTLLNPNTRTCPIFRSKGDAEITKSLYRRSPALQIEGEETYDPWNVSLTRLFMMDSDSHSFMSVHEAAEDQDLRRLYEAKLIWQFDHRYATFDDVSDEDIRQGNARSLPSRCPDVTSVPRFFVTQREVDRRYQRSGWTSSWALGLRDITNATNERTVVSAVLPREGAGNSLPLIVHGHDAAHAGCLCATLNSFCLDFAARQKIGGMHINWYILQQFPCLPPDRFDQLCRWSTRNTTLAWITTRVVELSYTAWDLEPFARDCGYDGSPFKWNEERRFLIRCELDAAFFHFYLGTEDEWQKNGTRELLGYFPTPRDAVAYIMETFPIVKRKDESKYGSYRTKDTILEIYDEMAEVMQLNASAVAAGRQPVARYQSRLDPLPGPPCDAQGNFIPMAQWDRANWPSHIHPPKEERIAVAAAVTAEQIADGVAVLYALALLHTWGKAADRRSFELGIILMQKDSLRERVLKKQTVSTGSSNARGLDIGNMDEFLGELVGTNTLAVENMDNRQLVKLGAAAPVKEELLADQDGKAAFVKAGQATKAVAILAEQSQSLDLYMGAEDYGPVEIAIS